MSNIARILSVKAKKMLCSENRKSRKFSKRKNCSVTKNKQGPVPRIFIFTGKEPLSQISLCVFSECTVNSNDNVYFVLDTLLHRSKGVIQQRQKTGKSIKKLFVHLAGITIFE